MRGLGDGIRRLVRWIQLERGVRGLLRQSRRLNRRRRLNRKRPGSQQRQRKPSRLLWIPTILVLVGTALGLALWFTSGPDDWKGLALNLATELVGAAVTYVLLVLILERTEDIESEKVRLIAEMGSSVLDIAVAATEKLKQRGWLSDGSLYGADLHHANLQRADLHGAYLHRAYLARVDLRRADLHMADLVGADLHMADLQGAILFGARLQEADLAYATLQGAVLNGAHLRGATLEAANLREAFLASADLEAAKLDESTILPDGTEWTPDTDLARFTECDHPESWHPGWVKYWRRAKDGLGYEFSPAVPPGTKYRY